jgi:hypothetical protein
MAQNYTAVDLNFPFTDATAFWEWDSQHSGGYGNGNYKPLEHDIGNFGQDAESLSNVLNWEGGGCGNPGGGWCATPWSGKISDKSVYHTYGFRITSDGSTDAVVCAYIDNVFQSCGSQHPQSDQYTNRGILIFQNGNTSNDRDAFLEFVRVWSCTNWKTTMCNGQVLTGAP